MDFRIEGGGFEARDDARSWEFRDVGLENWWGGIAGERISERVEAAHWEGEGEGGAPRATTNASGPLGWRWRRLPARV